MTPARLSFGTWREFRDGPPVTFFTLTTCSPRPESAVSDAMDFALDLWRHPARYTEAPYAAGAGAYDTWLDAIDGGHGDGVGMLRSDGGLEDYAADVRFEELREEALRGLLVVDARQEGTRLRRRNE